MKIAGLSPFILEQAGGRLLGERERASERESEKGCPFCSHVQRKSYSMIGEENGGEAKG